MEQEQEEVYKVKVKYRPHKFQKKFHVSKAKMRIFLGGIRSGKTTAGINEAIKLAIQGCDYFQTPNFGAIILPSYPMIHDIILPALERFIPVETLEYFSKFRLFLRFVNGSKILLRSADNPKRLKGLDLHWFYGDEMAQVPEEVIRIMQGRIAQRGGIGFVTSTPDFTGKGNKWLQREVKKSGTRDKKGNLISETIHCTSYDNPFFSVEEISQLKDDYSEDYFRQEIMAEFITFSGLVYPEFTDLNIIKREKLEFIDYLVGVDFGYSQPSAIIFLGILNERYYIIHEVFKKGMLIQDIKDEILKFAMDHRISKIYCDPSRPDFIDELKAQGLPAEKGDNRVLPGISKIKTLLKTSRLLVFQDLRNTLREFRSYSFKGDSDLPRKVDDHLMDALRYALTESQETQESSDKIVFW